MDFSKIQEIIESRNSPYIFIGVLILFLIILSFKIKKESTKEKSNKRKISIIFLVIIFLVIFTIISFYRGGKSLTGDIINSLNREENNFAQKDYSGTILDNYNIQNSINGTNIWFNSLGIGTTSTKSQLSLGTWNAGTAGTTGGSQLEISGTHNVGVNVGGAKLNISGYDNDETILYPIYVVDENGLTDFFIKNKPIPTGLSTAYFQGNVGIGTKSPTSLLNLNSLDTSAFLTFSESATQRGYIGYGDSGHIFTGAETDSMGVRAQGTLHLGAGGNNIVLTINGSTRNVGIGTISPSYPLEVARNVSGISIYSQANISATGYLTRTSVYDKTKGNALDKIQDADYYKNPDGTINHEKFYGYAGKFNTTNYSNEIIISKDKEVCLDVVKEETEEIITSCKNESYNEISYGIKQEEGIELGAEIDLLRQAVYELKEENRLLKSALCIIKPELDLCK